MSSPTDNLATVCRYLKAIESGAFSDIEPILAPGLTVNQLPNRIYPGGLRATRLQMAEGFAKGRKLFSVQTYEIRNALATADSVAIEVLWTGTLAIPFGTLDAGAQMRCYSAMFFQFQDGKLASQRNYDCFEPW